jgi:hypothetical protein
MAFRTAGTFTIAATNTPQPLFGSWVTAVSPGTAFAQAAGAPLTLTLGTAQSSGNDASQIFQGNGEPAWLVDPSGSNKGGVNAEEVRIAAVLNNTLTLGPKTITTPKTTNPFTENPHVAGSIGVGSFIIPKQMLNNFLVQYEDGGTGPFLYLGNYMLMTANLYRFYKLASVGTGTQPYFYNASMTSPGNPYDASELWVMGTSGDKYNVSLNID